MSGCFRAWLCMAGANVVHHVILLGSSVLTHDRLQTLARVHSRTSLPCSELQHQTGSSPDHQRFLLTTNAFSWPRTLFPDHRQVYCGWVARGRRQSRHLWWIHVALPAQGSHVPGGAVVHPLANAVSALFNASIAFIYFIVTVSLSLSVDVCVHSAICALFWTLLFWE